MTTPPADGSRRITGPTSLGATGDQDQPRDDLRNDLHHDLHDGGDRHLVQEKEVTVRRTAAPAPAPVQPTARPEPAVETRPARPAKTSAAAAFALVFGLAALFCALTALLSPVAIVFGILGLILAFAGLKMAKRPGVTGRGVAIGGLVTALLGLILGGVILGGLTAVVNNKSQLDRVQRYLDDARAKLPTSQQVRDNVTGQ